MKKKKMKKMSKNQLCSAIHELSGKSYKETRQICKAAKWDEATAVAMAFNSDKFVDTITSFCNSLRRIHSEMAETLHKTVNNLRPTVQSIKDSLRQARENMIQNDR